MEPDSAGGAAFFPPRVRLLGLAAGTAAVASLGLLLTGAPIGFWRSTGYLATVVAGLATVVLVARAVRPGPTLVVDSHGIVDRTTLLPVGRVRWEEIAAVRKRELGRGVGRERFLEVVLFDRDRFRTRPRGLPRRVVDGYRALVRHPDVTIPGSMVAAPLHLVVEAIRQAQPRVDVLELPPPEPGLVSRMFRPRFHPPRRRRPQFPRW